MTKYKIDPAKKGGDVSRLLPPPRLAGFYLALLYKTFNVSLLYLLLLNVRPITNKLE